MYHDARSHERQKSSGYVASLGKVMDWKGCGRSEPWPNVRHSLEVFLKGLREITRVMLEYHSGRLYVVSA